MVRVDCSPQIRRHATRPVSIVPCVVLAFAACTSQPDAPPDPRLWSSRTSQVLDCQGVRTETGRTLTQMGARVATENRSQITARRTRDGQTVTWTIRTVCTATNTSVEVRATGTGEMAEPSMLSAAEEELLSTLDRRVRMRWPSS